MLSTGAVIGETDIMFKRKVLDSYHTKTDCFFLRVSKTIFLKILREFKDIKQDFKKIAEFKKELR